MRAISLLNKMFYFFKVIEEGLHYNVIKSIQKDKNNVIFVIGPVNSNNESRLSAFDILRSNIIKSQISESDLKAIKAVAVSEGDLYIESKEYDNDNIRFQLRSVLTEEKWDISLSDLKKNSEILDRLHYKYRVSIDE